MPAPNAPVDFTSLDSGTDSPATARAALLDLAQKFNALVASYNLTQGLVQLDADARVPLALLPITPVAAGQKLIKSPGSTTWTVPAGVTSISVEAVGAGGGGAWGATRHGGGGGAGGYLRAVLRVTPGDVLEVTIGAGGNGGSRPPTGVNTPGQAGGNTTLSLKRPLTGVGTQERFAAVVYGGQAAFFDGSSNPIGGGNDGSLVTLFLDVLGDVFEVAGGNGASGLENMGGIGGSSYFRGSTPVPATFNWGGAGGYGSGTGGPDSASPGANGAVVITW